MKKKTEHGTRRGVIAAAGLILTAAAVLAAFLLSRRPAPGPAAVLTVPTEAPTVQTEGEEIRIDKPTETRLELGEGLVITEVAGYTGWYVEDGTDEPVSDVLMIVVTNEGELPLQYAEITLTGGTETAEFALTTLPAGASAVVLESSRKSYDGTVSYTAAAAENLVWFPEPLSCREDLLQIQQLDGALNVTNISGSDLEGDIVIYYKNSSADMFYGGITYRIRLSGGLPAGATRQVMADHFSERGSTVVFVTCG